MEFVDTKKEETEPKGANTTEELEPEEDRIRWLRERGVQIEIPGERRTKKSPSSSELLKEITIVKIPCDDRLPYEEIAISLDCSQPGDQLVAVLAPRFSSDGSDIDQEMLKETARKQFGTNGGAAVSEATLNALASQGTVEAFPLLHPCPSNRSTGVTAYLDETGALKGLPLNDRASAIGGLCGFQGVQLRGDVYLAKLHANPMKGIQNESFFLSDLASSSPWMKDAASINYQRGLETNKIAVSSTESEADIEAAKEKPAAGYRWSQTRSTAEIMLTLPKGTGSKNIAVKFAAKSVVVTMKTSSEILLQVELAGTVSTGDSTWGCTSSNGDTTLEITLEKTTEGLWSSLEQEK